MVQKIEWFVNAKLNIKDIDSFKEQIKPTEINWSSSLFEEPKKMTTGVYYILYKSVYKKKSPWTIRRGMYISETYNKCWYEVTRSWGYELLAGHRWNASLGEDEHKLCNDLYLSDTKSTLVRLQKEFNTEHNKTLL